jgi:hypothetical protein
LHVDWTRKCAREITRKNSLKPLALSF